jgi:putative sterol carrier protein
VADPVPYLEAIRAKFDDPVTQEKMSGFSKTIQFNFTDSNESYVLTVKDGKTAAVEKKSLPDANILITWSTDTFAGIQDKKVNPMTSYMTGKLKVKGPMEDLLKLQKFMM